MYFLYLEHYGKGNTKVTASILCQRIKRVNEKAPYIELAFIAKYCMLNGVWYMDNLNDEMLTL